MRPSGIVSRSISLRPVDFESGRKEGLLRKFLLEVRSRFEGKAEPGKRGCCHKSLAGLGVLPFAFGQVAAVELGVELAGDIQHVPAHNKPCATIIPEIDPISPDQLSDQQSAFCSLLSGIPIYPRITSIRSFRMTLPPTPTSFQRIPVDILFRFNLEC
jgi:hypothetical protein